MRGLRIGLTGGLQDTTRQAFKERIARAGATYITRMEEGIDVLVVGSSPLRSKIDAAQQGGAEVVPWEDFQTRLQQPVDDSVPLADPTHSGPPALAIDATTVRILDILLERGQPGPLTPSREAFPSYVLDTPTLTLLRGIARATALSQPCLIEGETSTSKTSSVRFLASLVNAQVVRLNLNGQTDTSELIGRYLPDGTGWRFAEGLVPQAMRNGWWVVLDEVNLAESSVLERLNPCLERVPELVLTEGPGTRFGPNGDLPVHPSFRIFATMNPAEYTGRSVLSEAWRDRFVSHLSARPPGEAEYLHLIEHALTGRHPRVEIEGISWAPAALEEPPRPLLQHPELHTHLPRLAPLFAGLTEMTRVVAGRAAPLGVDRRERYIFSRRGLLGLLDALETLERWDPIDNQRVTVADHPLQALREAVRSATIERMHAETDRERVALLVRSLGF